jgi:hypothetical protein
MNLKLLCIDSFPYYNGRPRKPSDPPGPQIGDEVVAIEVISKGKKDYYILLGYPDNEVYDSVCFAILPSQDADAMQDEQKECIVNLEKAAV